MVMDVSQIPTELIEQENQRRIKNNVMQAVMPLFDFQNRMKEVHPGITNDAINGISQGLNNGYKDIDEYQTLANIRKPQNQEEIDLAKQGQFNLPEQNNQSMVSNILGKVKGGLSDVAAGYKDNTMNGFNFGNLQADPNKSGWQRLGEALGTGARVLGNPALQGALAGAIYGKYKGDALEGLKYGFDWAQNKSKSDYYAKKLGKAPGILGGYGKEDYNADVLSQYRETMADNARLKTQAQLDKTNPKMQDYAETMLASGLWDENEYNAFISGNNYVPDQRLNMNVVKEMTNKAYKEKGIQIKDKELSAKINHWANQDSNNATRTAIYGQSVQNSKTNSDRNYNLKKEKFEWEKEHPKGNKGGGSKQSGTLVKVIAPNGQTGTIPIGNLEAATKAGYKVAN